MWTRVRFDQAPWRRSIDRCPRCALPLSQRSSGSPPAAVLVRASERRSSAPVHRVAAARGVLARRLRAVRARLHVLIACIRRKACSAMIPRPTREPTPGADRRSSAGLMLRQLREVAATQTPMLTWRFDGFPLPQPLEAVAGCLRVRDATRRKRCADAPAPKCRNQRDVRHQEAWVRAAPVPHEATHFKLPTTVRTRPH